MCMTLSGGSCPVPHVFYMLEASTPRDALNMQCFTVHMHIAREAGTHYYHARVSNQGCEEKSFSLSRWKTRDARKATKTLATRKGLGDYMY